MCIGHRGPERRSHRRRKIQLPETDRRRARAIPAKRHYVVVWMSVRVTRRKSTRHGPSPKRGAVYNTSYYNILYTM